MKDTKILIIDGDIEVRRVIKQFLAGEGFTADESGDGSEGLNKIAANNYSLVLMDVMMQTMDGWKVCKRIRECSNVPIIILTARDEAYDKLLGFELGADDYVTKPFNPKEVVSRIKAVLKRTQRMNESAKESLEIDKLKINPATREVFLDDREILLTPKEYILLYYLVKNKERIFTREELLNWVWGYDFYGDLRTVDTHIKQLREKLGEFKNYIHTVWGVGYKFKIT